MTRFCPNLYSGKSLHLGHAAILLLTRHWAHHHGVGFFHLLGFRSTHPPDLDDAIGSRIDQWNWNNQHSFSCQLDHSVMRQVHLLLQWVPAPTISTLFCPERGQAVDATRWCDEVMGTTDIWRGNDCLGVYEPDPPVKVHYLPLLTHPDIGPINCDVASGRFRLENQVCYFNSQWHLLYAIMQLVTATYEVDDKGVAHATSAIFHQRAWDTIRADTAAASDRCARDTVHRWLGLKDPP